MQKEKNIKDRNRIVFLLSGFVVGVSQKHLIWKFILHWVDPQTNTKIKCISKYVFLPSHLTPPPLPPYSIILGSYCPILKIKCLNCILDNLFSDTPLDQLIVQLNCITFGYLLATFFWDVFPKVDMQLKSCNRKVQSTAVDCLVKHDFQTWTHQYVQYLSSFPLFCLAK